MLFLYKGLLIPVLDPEAKNIDVDPTPKVEPGPPVYLNISVPNGDIPVNGLTEIEFVIFESFSKINLFVLSAVTPIITSLSAYLGENSPLGNKPCLLKWAPTADSPTCANVLVGKYGPLFGCIWGVGIFDACVLTFVWDKTFCLAIKS